MSNPLDGISAMQWVDLLIVGGGLIAGIVWLMNHNFDREFAHVSDLKDHLSQSTLVKGISRPVRRGGKYAFDLMVVGSEKPLPLMYHHRAHIIGYTMGNVEGHVKHRLGRSTTPDLPAFEKWLLIVTPMIKGDSEYSVAEMVTPQ